MSQDFLPLMLKQLKKLMEFPNRNSFPDVPSRIKTMTCLFFKPNIKLTELYNILGCGNTNLCTLQTVGINITTLSLVSCIDMPFKIGVSTNLYLMALFSRFMSRLCSAISKIS